MPEQHQSYYSSIYSSKPYDETRYHGLWDIVYEWAGAPKVVCDFGCGIGGMLSRWPNPPRLLGFDFSEEAIRQAIETKCGAGFFQHDISDPLPGTFPRPTLSTCIQVLEHIEDDVGVFNRMCEISERVICSVPYQNLIPSAGHVEDRFYDEEMIEKRFGAMHRIERVFNHFMIFEWRKASQ